MVEKLESLCLLKVVYNLSFNHKILKWLKKDLPKNIGEKIFEKSIKIVPEFSNDDLQFFQKGIINIKNIEMFRKQFDSINCYDFLNGHDIDNLITGNPTDFEIKSKNFSLKIKNLTVSFVDEEIFEKMIILFKNCCVTNSIKVESNLMKYTDASKSLFDSLDKSIKSVNLFDLDINFKHIKMIMETLKDKKELEELKLNLYALKKEKINANELKEYFKLIPNNISRLSFQLDCDQKMIFSFIPMVLKKLRNLKYFNFSIMPEKEDLSIEMLKTLEKYNTATLETLDLMFIDMSEKIKLSVSKLVGRCRSLRQLIIVPGVGACNTFTSEMLESLEPIAQNLRLCKIPFPNEGRLRRSLKRLVLKFCSLTSLNLGDFINLNFDNDCLIKIIQSNQKKLQEFDISNCNLKQSLIERLNFKKFSSLIDLNLSNVNFEADISVEFFKKIQAGNCGKTLKSLKIALCCIDEASEKYFGLFLKTCNRLEEIYLETIISSSSLYRHIISGLNSCKNTLNSFSLIKCKFNDKQGTLLFRFFEKCTNMKSVVLCKNSLTSEVVFDILQSLENSRGTLEQFCANHLYDDDYLDQHIQDLADTFHNLIDFQVSENMESYDEYAEFGDYFGSDEYEFDN